VIERLLPPAISVVATREDDPGTALFPEEAALLGRTTEGRQAEFVTARCCARAALRRLGREDAAILRGPRREPQWPAGIVGSITHCDGYRAAAVAPAADVLTVGIDAEPHFVLPSDAAERALSDEERVWVRQAPAGIHWDRVIFSAKECVYKAWFPLARRWLGFDEAAIEIDPATATFRARLLIKPPDDVPAEFNGRYLVEDGLVLTAIAVGRL